ncbi:Heat-inducible transcription repressor HrcA [hydrothermal vent metagenome]|uniref:Heat-inducible transcription repressor HrcA n=1 Tax=hydrothermal vent metagenome TaxID=652676 RepID=A0A3B1A4B7_9ZZZZ
MSPKEVNSDRTQLLMKTLVERYINDGQPVGSQKLANDSKLNLSPATIRSVMADLEDNGFLSSAHKSAGRVPTASGYRMFVDSLLTVKPLNDGALQQIRGELTKDEDSAQLVDSASTLLSGISNMAGVVMVPRREHVSFKQMEFIPLSDNKVLVIIICNICNNSEVQNRIINTTRNYTRSELQFATNFLNEKFAGKELYEIRVELFNDLQQTQIDMNEMMTSAVSMASQAFVKETETDDYILAGQNNLMNYAEMSSVESLKQLFDAFNTKRDILSLLDQSIYAESMQIFIGKESGHQALDECSVVAAPYRVADEIVGVLGVIGPTRMAYDRVIPLVDITAKLLSNALSSE